jgi:hypothetical protein
MIHIPFDWWVESEVLIARGSPHLVALRSVGRTIERMNRKTAG